MTNESKTTCDKCGIAYGVGDSPWCRDHHVRVAPGKGFEPYFDNGLGQYVTGWGDVRKGMRENVLDFRDHPSPGDTSARRDKLNEQSRRQ